MIKIAACRLALIAVMLALAGAAAASEGAPRRIVSFNLCSDQLLVALADPEQIAGLSPYAVNANLSVVAAQAARFPRLDWNAESVVSLAPDLVLIGGRSDRPTQAMLTAMGMRVVDVGMISDLESAEREARQFGALVGHPERGEALADAIADAARKLRAQTSSSARTALIIERRGYVAGPSSLAAAMIAAAGLRPPAGTPPGYGGFVALEQLLVTPPDMLVLKDAPDVATDQGALFLTHPALRALYPSERRINLPTRYTLCGGPALLEGLGYLTGVLATQR